MIENYTVALFGESERGKLHRAHYCEDLPQLIEVLGHPPAESRGLYFAIQALLYERKLLYFRVEEEGYSYRDYFEGIRLLKKEGITENLAAICLPGVGNSEIIEAVIPVCRQNNSIIIVTEPDLYDYLTDRK